jgi:Flp pilus assembly protein TadG
MKRSERGANLVEFALVAPVLVILLLGIADVGRAFYDYISLTNAVREGARYATRRPLETENIQKRTFIEIANADPSLKCGTWANVEVKTETDATGSAKRVKLKCDFTTISPLIFKTGKFSMTATAAMKVEGPKLP